MHIAPGPAQALTAHGSKIIPAKKDEDTYKESRTRGCAHIRTYELVFRLLRDKVCGSFSGVGISSARALLQPFGYSSASSLSLQHCRAILSAGPELK